MEIISKNHIIFFIGAIGYAIIEVAFRGYTHWTMILTGGLCFFLVYRMFEYMEEMPVLLKCLVGMGIITGVEFIVGCIVNLWLGWEVWDYTEFRFQILGQICLGFSFAWFLLCAPISFVSCRIRRYLDFPRKDTQA